MNLFNNILSFGALITGCAIVFFLYTHRAKFFYQTKDQVPDAVTTLVERVETFLDEFARKYVPPDAGPQTSSTPVPTIARAAKTIPHVPLATTGEEIDRQLASARLSEDEEEGVATALVEITKQLLLLVEMQRDEHRKDT